MNTVKRFNKSIAILITVVFFLASNIFAQQRQGQGPPPIPNDTQINKMVGELSSNLSLTDDQTTEILGLYQEHFSEVKLLMSNGQRPRREEMENLKEEFEDDVKSLLTDEQQELFDEFIKNNNPQKGQGRQRQQNRR